MNLNLDLNPTQSHESDLLERDYLEIFNIDDYIYIYVGPKFMQESQKCSITHFSQIYKFVGLFLLCFHKKEEENGCDLNLQSLMACMVVDSGLGLTHWRRRTNGTAK